VEKPVENRPELGGYARHTKRAEKIASAPQKRRTATASQSCSVQTGRAGVATMAVATAKVLPLPVLPLGEQADLLRIEASRTLDPEQRSTLGQYLTPCGIAALMASLFQQFSPSVRLLDAGAGAGSLVSAVVAEMCGRRGAPARVDAVAYEIDLGLITYLKRSLDACKAECDRHGVQFSGHVVPSDFIASAVRDIDGGLFWSNGPRFTHAILNPPYHKLNAHSKERRLLRRAGIETSNLYAGFVALAIQLLEPGGELVAITPRSFCNGPYFRPFREFLLHKTAVQHVHLFESRTASFADDDVLQENVIFHVIKGAQQGSVLVSVSEGPDDEMPSIREVPFEQIVSLGDPESFIRLVPDDSGRRIADAYASLPCTLRDLGLTVSTGKVVDFRVRHHLRPEPGKGTQPLVYPTHFADGVVRWPKQGKKPNALADVHGTGDLWMPSGTYVLAKRFSSKEERRRVVAAVFDPEIVPAEKVGFENHLNVFHAEGAGLDPAVARGLAAFLNSTFVDTFFRQFSGHTQVNATDLRSLRYPSVAALDEIGRRTTGISQQPLDEVVESVLGLSAMDNPLMRTRRIDEALTVLKALDMPRAQQNERSALTLLAILDLKADLAWSKAEAPMIGITPIMNFIRDHYGKTYAPNTRETVRRQTVHQFLDAGLIVANPDKLGRAVNSPKAVYQIEAKALELLRAYGSASWASYLTSYLQQAETLATRYAQARDMPRIPVTLPLSEGILNLTPGGQNDLIKEIIEDFCPAFAPGGHIIYVGDTGDKFAVFDEPSLRALGVVVDSHGKMPDVLVHRKDKNWLLLIEAVTSHGPVNAKRRAELAKLFAGSKAGLVYVTTFLTRKAMLKYLVDISWETEVWVAESPGHMIHFDGERFLGLYGS
jgi:adenine-specific DNA-methyltransferase